MAGSGGEWLAAAGAHSLLLVDQRPGERARVRVVVLRGDAEGGAPARAFPQPAYVEGCVLCVEQTYDAQLGLHAPLVAALSDANVLTVLWPQSVLDASLSVALPPKAVPVACSLLSGPLIALRLRRGDAESAPVANVTVHRVGDGEVVTAPLPQGAAEAVAVATMRGADDMRLWSSHAEGGLAEWALREGRWAPPVTPLVPQPLLAAASALCVVDAAQPPLLVVATEAAEILVRRGGRVVAAAGLGGAARWLRVVRAVGDDLSLLAGTDAPPMSAASSCVGLYHFDLSDSVSTCPAAAAAAAAAPTSASPANTVSAWVRLHSPPLPLPSVGAASRAACSWSVAFAGAGPMAVRGWVAALPRDCGAAFVLALASCVRIGGAEGCEALGMDGITLLRATASGVASAAAADAPTPPPSESLTVVLEGLRARCEAGAAALERLRARLREKEELLEAAVAGSGPPPALSPLLPLLQPTERSARAAFAALSSPAAFPFKRDGGGRVFAWRPLRVVCVFDAARGWLVRARLRNETQRQLRDVRLTAVCFGCAMVCDAPAESVAPGAVCDLSALLHCGSGVAGARADLVRLLVAARRGADGSGAEEGKKEEEAAEAESIEEVADVELEWLPRSPQLERVLVVGDEEAPLDAEPPHPLRHSVALTLVADASTGAGAMFPDPARAKRGLLALPEVLSAFGAVRRARRDDDGVSERESVECRGNALHVTAEFDAAQARLRVQSEELAAAWRVVCAIATRVACRPTALEARAGADLLAADLRVLRSSLANIDALLDVARERKAAGAGESGPDADVLKLLALDQLGAQ